MAFIDTQDTPFTMTNDKKTYSSAKQCAQRKKRQYERKQRNKKGTMKGNLLNKVLYNVHFSQRRNIVFFYHSKIDAIYQVPHFVCEFVMLIAIKRYAYEWNWKKKRKTAKWSIQWAFFLHTASVYLNSKLSVKEKISTLHKSWCAHSMQHGLHFEVLIDSVVSRASLHNNNK